MPAVTALSDYLLKTSPSVIQANLFVRLVSNVTGTSYISDAVTDANGKFSFLNNPPPPGLYTVFTGPVGTIIGTPTATGDTSYVVPDIGQAPNGLPLGQGGFWYDVHAYGLTADNESVDGTVPLQNTINAVPIGISGTDLVASEVNLRGASIKVTANIAVTGRAIIFKGSGIGNPAGTGTVTSRGTVISWQGAAGVAMFTFSAYQFVVFEDIVFEGNAASVPSDLLYFDGTSQAYGAAHKVFIRRCLLGAFLTSTRAPTGQLAATNAVRFGGANTNNDQMHLDECSIAWCGTGFNLVNAQSVWGQASQTTFDSCPTAGIATAASMLVVNPGFNACAIDLKISGTAKVVVLKINSENSFQIAQLTADGCRLHIDGGHVTNSANMGTNWIDHQSCGNGGAVILDGVTFILAGLAHRKVKARGLAAGAGLTGAVSIRDCSGLALADLDIANVVSGDDLNVTVETGSLFVRQKLRGGGFIDVLSTTGQMLQVQGALQHSTQTTTPVGAAPTYTPDATLGEVQEIIQGTSGQTLTIAAPANRLAGQFHTFKLVHFADAVAWTLTFNAVYKRSGGAFANTNTSGAVDTITFYDDGTSLREVGRSINQS